MRFLHKVSDIVYKISGCIIMTFLFCIMTFTFIQVISRYLFHFSIAWSQELIVYMLIWLVFLGCSMGLKKGEVASLTMVTDKLSPTWQRIARILVNAILVFFFITTVISNQELIRFAARRKSSIMKLNMAVVSSAYTVGSVIMAYNCVLAIIDDIISWVKGDRKEVKA